MPSAGLFWLFHRLIPVIVLSSEVPVTGRVRKEGVKVCTPKSPPPADDSAFDLSPADVFAQCARAEPQHDAHRADWPDGSSQRQCIALPGDSKTPEKVF
jgi:hypothetical protein